MFDKSFKKLLLTFKKYDKETYEILYISKDVLHLLKRHEKFYHATFFDRVFPTVERPFFETLFANLGKGLNMEVPLFIEEDVFQWVRVEGYTISQEDNTYLVNAIIIPTNLPHLQASWIIHNQKETLGTCADNHTLTKLENKIELVHHLAKKYRFPGAKGILEKLESKKPFSIEIYPGALRLQSVCLGNGYQLLELRKEGQNKGVPNVVEGEMLSITDRILGIIYFEYLPKSGEIVWSGAISELLGYEDAVFKRYSVWDWMELIHPDDQQHFETILKEDDHTQEAYENLYRVRHRSGRYIYVRNTVKTFFNLSIGEKVIIGMINDISELKEAEESLKEKEGQIRELSEKEFIQDILHKITEISTLYKDKSFFDHVVKLLTQKLGLAYGVIGNYDETPGSIDIISLSHKGKLISKDISNWQRFLEDEKESFTKEQDNFFMVKADFHCRFPVNGFLERKKITSFIAVNIVSKGGEKIGMLCFFDTKPIVDENLYKGLFRILGDWIALELHRFRYEASLVETNYMHDAILNGTDYGIFAVNHKLEITLINENTLPVFNLKSKSKLLATVLAKNDRNHTLADIIKEASSSRKKTDYYLLKTGNNEFRELKISFTRIKYGKKNQISYVVFVDDITDRTLSEKKLIESEQLYRCIAENFPRGTIDVLDKSLRYIYTEGKEYRRMGIEPKALIGTRHLDQYEGGENYDIARSHLDRVLAGEMVTYEISYKNQKYLKIGVPLVNNEGEVDRILLVKQNITQAKKLESEREKLIKDLKSHNEELLRFAYIVSHNLRAPIVNISLLLDLYDEANPDNPENSEVIENLKISTNLLNTTLQDLIEVVSIKKQKIPKVELINFRSLLNNIEKSLFNQLREAGTIIHKDFRALEEMNYVYAHMENFFMNFMTNSVKYRHPDRMPEMWITTYKENDYCVIRFEDNGIGLDLERYGDRIFGLYQRFHNHVEGKGLGLYLVREQIRANDGKITIESEVGKGTVFKIYLRNLIRNESADFR
ncbi:PAS domain S-box protein [Negadavirga shengliensis]|uniref:histidine kinase n=1 Tax=Negadavirga shengliensis TaxID=1389218 RepID=A0ABV9T0V8_9BACT